MRYLILIFLASTPVEHMAWQYCHTGSGVPYHDRDCAVFDLDHDGDVDQSDFGMLQTKEQTLECIVVVRQVMTKTELDQPICQIDRDGCVVKKWESQR